MDKDQKIQLIDENLINIEFYIDQKVKFWMEHVLFSGLWWFGFILSIVPWVIWFFFRKKESTDRLLYIGVLVMVISLVFDILGDQFALWHYRFNVVPILPTYFPWDLTLMPVTVMLLLQVKPKGSPYLKALLFALVTAYAAEPFIHWLKIYDPKNWRFSYSVPIQFGIYMFAHYLSRRNKFVELAK
ncbi:MULTISPECIES: CBO0543 family protein [Paenibacillus]|uniref:CBO0543 family protein n=1 Tax=Paenibacillus TaxID=44249 RepID=UPI0022B8B4F2|nr:CBO0543 family protein [Paenibacillus caseinilyticus]MCZ8517905.1 hypothetical protein [Paenibacillus caseinilyticus]